MTTNDDKRAEAVRGQLDAMSHFDLIDVAKAEHMDAWYWVHENIVRERVTRHVTERVREGVDAPMDLLPCPICGAPATIDYSIIDGAGRWHIQCPEKGEDHVLIFCVCDTYKQAVKVWNTRGEAARYSHG